MKNIFKRKSDSDRHKMEWADYALVVFMALVLLGLLYFVTETFF